MAFISIETDQATGTRLTFMLPRLSPQRDFFKPMAAPYRAWRRWQSERILEALPQDIRKDIGYPSSTQIDR